MSPFYQKYENLKDLLYVFDSYIPKHRSGGDVGRSDEMSDVDNEIDNKDVGNYNDSDIVSSEYGGNIMVHNRRYGYTKRFK